MKYDKNHIACGTLFDKILLTTLTLCFNQYIVGNNIVSLLQNQTQKVLKKQQSIMGSELNDCKF